MRVRTCDGAPAPLRRSVRRGRPAPAPRPPEVRLKSRHDDRSPRGPGRPPLRLRSALARGIAGLVAGAAVGGLLSVGEGRVGADAVCVRVAVAEEGPVADPGDPGRGLLQTAGHPGPVAEPGTPRLGDGCVDAGAAATAAGGPAKASRRPRRRATLPPLDDRALREEDSRRTSGREWKRWNRVGVVRDLTPLRTPPRPSRWRDAETLPDGARVWRGVVEAPGAAGLRLRFAALDLPKGAELTVSDADEPAETYGPLRVSDLAPGDFGPTVFGERVVVALRVPAESLDTRVHLAVDGVAHRYRAAEETWDQGPRPRAAFRAGAGGGGLSCMNPIACDAAWTADVARAVGRYEVTTGRDVFLCTGTLVADSDPETAVPYFLTAHHCVATEKSARSVEVFWDYRTPTCDGAPPSLLTLPRTLGATLLATSADTDVSLLRLTGALPPGRYFAGWTAVAPTVGDPVVGVHHPQGSHLRISYGGVHTRSSTRIDVVWTDGVTASGSSGSALFNADRQIVGQLCCGESFCNDPQAPDEYGRFDVSYVRRLSTWLGHGEPVEGEPDPWDPDDDVASGATYLGAPDSIALTHGSHTLVQGDAEDWYAFLLEGGVAYRFEASGGVRADLHRTPTGPPVASDPGSDGSGFRLDHTAGGSGTATHWLRVRRADDAADAAYTLRFQRPVTKSPARARSLRADVAAARKVRLRWLDRSREELGYRVELSGPAGFVTLAHLPPNSRRFEHRPGVGAHVYRVVAFNGAGESPADVRVRIRGRSGLDASDPTDDNGAGATDLGADVAGTTEQRELDRNDPADWYRLDLVAGRSYVFSTSGDGDTIGAVYADAGGQELLAIADDADPIHELGRNFRIVYTPAAGGPVWIEVRSYAAEPRASYRFVWE